jgi:hypothetical protein
LFHLFLRAKTLRRQNPQKFSGVPLRTQIKESFGGILEANAQNSKDVFATDWTDQKLHLPISQTLHTTSLQPVLTPETLALRNPSVSSQQYIQPAREYTGLI